MTFLLARAHGTPLVLLPAVVLGRFQHPFLVYDRERGPLAPGDLAGRRVGVRSYSVTTGVWVRGILADDWGVDLGRVTWVTFEPPHVAEFRDPPNVERAPAGKDLMAMVEEVYRRRGRRPTAWTRPPSASRRAGAPWRSPSTRWPGRG